MLSRTIREDYYSARPWWSLKCDLLPNSIEMVILIGEPLYMGVSSMIFSRVAVCNRKCTMPRIRFSTLKLMHVAFKLDALAS